MRTDDDEPGGSPEDDLMIATARALSSHGMAELTTQRVADEWGKSQSLVHYYYATKEDLIVGFVRYLRDRSRENYRRHRDDPPEERVEWILRRHFAGPHRPAEPGLSHALVEIQGQSAHNERYRTALEALNDDARAFLGAAIRDGVESGAFRDVDVDATVTFLLSAVSGGVLRVGLFDRDDAGAQLLGGFDHYLEAALRAVPGE